MEFVFHDDYESREAAYIKDSKQKKVFTVGNFRLYECPLTLINSESRELIDICYLIDSTGVLLFSGGWANQPDWLWEAYKIYKIETGKTDG